VVVAVQAPADPAFDPARLRALMARRGFLLPPARGGEADGLRIGCIGAIDADTIRRAVAALGEALDDLGVVQRAPAATAASRP
jgi:2-aminoethylphosphonate-pyruvate transaminase